MQVLEYLATFTRYDWLWKDSADAAYAKFMKQVPCYHTVGYLGFGPIEI